MIMKVCKRLGVAGIVVAGLVTGYKSVYDNTVIASQMAADGTIQVTYANGDNGTFNLDALKNEQIVSCQVDNDGRVQVQYLDGSTSVFYISFDR